jgi:hypothetical protein
MRPIATTEAIDRPLLPATPCQKDMKMTEPANPRQLRLERLSPSYWRVTFDHPPLNIFGPETIPQLEEVQRPASQARLKKLMERGFHKPGDAENRLGYYVGQLGA